MDLTVALTGMLPFVVIASAVLAAIVSGLLLRFYRRAVVRAMAAGVSQATVPTMAGMVGALSGVLLVTILSRRAAHEVQFLEDSLTMDH